MLTSQEDLGQVSRYPLATVSILEVDMIIITYFAFWGSKVSIFKVHEVASDRILEIDFRGVFLVNMWSQVSLRLRNIRDMEGSFILPFAHIVKSVQCDYQ